MVVAAVCWSSGGFLVRQLAITDAWKIVFWRGAFMTLFVVGVLVALHARAILKEAVPLRTWVAMTVAFGGIVVMFAPGRGRRASAGQPARARRRAASPSTSDLKRLPGARIPGAFVRYDPQTVATTRSR